MLSFLFSRRAPALCVRRAQIPSIRTLCTHNKPSSSPRVHPKRKNAFEPAQRRNYSDHNEKERNAIGVFGPRAAFAFLATGVALWFYFRNEKLRLKEEKEKERASKQYGRPNLGGQFTLTSHEGKPFTEEELEGKWSLVYFGFTNCPDICPAELDKISTVLDTVQKEHGDIFLPLFITVDPARDLPHRIARYLEDFHPSFIGLFGDYDATKAICKKYRVYFSTPANADPKGDYLVDHSIFVYLMDPQGKFVDAFGQSVPQEDVVEKINKEVNDWQRQTGKKA
ncbi:h-sco1 [Coprinopsis marcescibilis]|uniref:H-sco1 n=1 Tax=Coprinopsis marcescibilis TaxID=230819 RepID=A0A5C3L6J9_COPMA|nr:h-sco1 [Coprinopsis marcescibilis]